MVRGGRRPGAGRKKGAIGKKTAEQLTAVAEGTQPLAYMLGVMRDETADIQRRDDMAKAAAPYCHARLSSIDGDLRLHLHKHEEALAELE